VYATVFGELIDAEPGRLVLEYSRKPWTPKPWQRLERDEAELEIADGPTRSDRP